MNKHIKGYLFIEVVIAMLVFVMVGLSIFTSIGFLQVRVKKSEFQEDAVIVLQEGLEISQNSLFVDWNNYPDGEYKVAYDADEDKWVLLSGKETSIKSRYERSLFLSSVCRDSSNGDRISYFDGSCSGEIDGNSRLINGIVSWNEGGQEVNIDSELLTFKIPE